MSTEPNDTTPVEIDIDALIDGAQLAERSMPLCLRPDLVARYEELDVRRARAGGQNADSLAGAGGEAAEIRAQMDDLREQMIASTVTVTVRALPRPKFQRLLKMHPVRRDEDGTVNPDDAEFGANTATFWGALLRASWVAPVMSKARLDKLLDELLSDRQFEKLGNLAFAVNRGEVDLNF